MEMPFAGQTFGSYEVQGLLGSGGMGEVYRARDSKLKRDVAIKVLPDAFSRDPERVARFQREAEVLASLNHPHIAAIYDLGHFGELQFLVLELVEGETLADRLTRGPIPVQEALRIARQIAEALEAAHEKGIIHRDLKPANIKITTDDHVKVLDFGLAKICKTEGTASSNAPTKVTASTDRTIMGTPGYMSPEQAKGAEAERRSDIWAFGCVLYEMLTGRGVFEGETVSEILAEVLKSEPDWNRLPGETPESIRRLLRRCLQREEKLRLRDAGDARIEIEDAIRGIDGQMAPVSARRGGRLAWVSAFALLTMVVAIGERFFRVVPTAAEARLEINTPAVRDGESLASLAISPDGQKIVFAATSAGQSQLWLRTLDSVSARPLTSTERAELPFWSPDSRSIGFFADAELRRVDLDGGSLQTLAHAQAFLGGAWNREGTIVFSPNPGRPLFQIPAKGGEPAVATPYEGPQQTSQRSPQFLPDGHHFLYFVTGNSEARGVYVGQLDGLKTHRLFDADSPAVYSSTGHLLFMRQGTLLAQGFDPDRLELNGNTFPVAEHIGRSVLSASAAGAIVYRTLPTGGGQQEFVWIDRSGREIDKVVYPNASNGIGPALSPDGHHLSMFKPENGNMDIWSFDVPRRAWNRITFDSRDDIFPLWSPDGRSVVFSSNRISGIMNIYRKLLSGSPGSEELLLTSPQINWATDWSHDARFLLFDSIDPKRGGPDIWALPLEGERKPFEVVHTEFNEQAGQFSPDGKWIAYQSDKPGHSEIYLQPFHGAGDGVLVSTNGGTQVRWNPNGKELFYIGPDGRLMMVAIRLPVDGQAVELGTPAALFATSVNPNYFRHQYMVSPDGQSFIMNFNEPISASPITIILNWKAKP